MSCLDLDIFVFAKVQADDIPLFAKVQADVRASSPIVLALNPNMHASNPDVPASNPGSVIGFHLISYDAHCISLVSLTSM